jgi:hypothetical protein
MKKKLTVLLAFAVMSMSSVYAAEAQGPISRWLDNMTGSVAQKEQRAHQKSVQRQQKLAAKQKARQQKLAQKRAKAKQKELERRKKAAERQKQAQHKKNLMKELFSH